MRNALRLTAVLAILGWTGLAQAGHIACDGDTAAKVSNTSACALGHENNDFLNNGLQVNEDQMFGFNDWEFAQKDDDLDGVDETDINVGLVLTGSLLVGEWAIDDIWGTFSEVMLVFKGGNGNNTNPTYVGYLLEFGEVVGSYETPFANVNGGGAGNPKDISHVSIYVRRGDDDMSVPEPGTLTLLGLGLAALGFARRRKTA